MTNDSIIKRGCRVADSKENLAALAMGRMPRTRAERAKGLTEQETIMEELVVKYRVYLDKVAKLHHLTIEDAASYYGEDLILFYMTNKKLESVGFDQLSESEQNVIRDFEEFIGIDIRTL